MKKAYIVLILLIAVVVIYEVSIHRDSTIIGANFDLHTATSSESLNTNTTATSTTPCPEGYIPVASGAGQPSSCAKQPQPNANNYLVGTGTQEYSLKGYYHEYVYKFYPLDYDPQRDTGYPKDIACHGFLVTDGDQAFIAGYKQKIHPSDGKVVINLDPDFSTSSTTVAIPQQIKNSTEANPTNITVKVNPLPERDVVPCDSWGIYIVSPNK